MKKRVVPFLLLALLLCASCGKTTAKPETTGVTSVVGAWEMAQSPDLTPQLLALKDKAFASFGGAEYEPVAYLARQIASGTNYRLLCRTNSVLPDGTQTYSIVELHEAANGDAQITDIVDSVVPTNVRSAENLSGGWTQPESVAVPDNVRDALRKTGTENEPVACLAAQVVAGMNYCVLCKGADADDAYTFLYLNIDLQGNAKLTDVVRFTEGSDNENRD